MEPRLTRAHLAAAGVPDELLQKAAVGNIPWMDILRAIVKLGLPLAEQLIQKWLDGSVPTGTIPPP